MPKRWSRNLQAFSWVQGAAQGRRPRDLAWSWARWLIILVALSIAVGSAVALFLWSLGQATRLRFDYPWLLYLLPFGGVLIVLLYRWAGGEAERGNNLIITTLHEPTTTTIPARMAPLVLLATVMTHLFGGSAGREGTAVQIGGAFAGGFNRYLRLEPGGFRVVVMAGIAAGFGAVFGTPVAGAIFAIEVSTPGRFENHAFVPALLAAFVADYTTTAWGIEHTHYTIASDAAMISPLVLLKVLIASVAFGAASTVFTQSVHLAARLSRRLIRWPLLRPVGGALAVMLLVLLVGSKDYLGLGVSNPDPGATSIVSSFEADGAFPFAWLWKTIFTAVTLGSGFKGGEVTPLFFVGASLGNVLAALLDAPADLFAGLGFVAVFAGAANTPLASAVMGVELFGGRYALYLALACFIARAVSGHGGIYIAQRRHRPAHPQRVDRERTNQ